MHKSEDELTSDSSTSKVKSTDFMNLFLPNLFTPVQPCTAMFTQVNITSGFVLVPHSPVVNPTSPEGVKRPQQTNPGKPCPDHLSQLASDCP